MIGTLINAATIILGSLIGLFLKNGLNEKLSKSIMAAVGLSVILIGLQGALKTSDSLLVIISMVVGTPAGTAIDIDAKMNKLGLWAQHKLVRSETDDNSFAKGFVSASLVYCVGAMAVVGALDSGIRGDHSTLIAKAALDGITAIIFAGSMGIGVMLSAVAVFIYQGLIAIFGSAIAPFLTDVLIQEMSAVGGLMIAAIGINMISDRNIKVANMLPGLLVPFIYIPIYNLIVR